MEVYQQGDVVYKRVGGCNPSRSAGIALTDLEIGGETGHKHVVRQIALLEQGTHEGINQSVIEVPEPRRVEHPQHESFVLQTGTYQVYRVRDADPFQGRGD